VAVGACLLAVLVVGALQSDGVSTWLVNRIASRLNPYSGSRLTVDRVSGSWIRSLRVEGLRLARVEEEGPGGPELTLDTLALRYRLLPLLVRRVHLRAARVTGLDARFTQRPDSLWDFLLPFQAETNPEEEEEGGRGFHLRVGTIRILDSTARMTFAPGNPAEAPDRLEVEELSLLMTGLESGRGGWAADLDTLHARFLPPGEAFDRVLLEGKGSLAEGRLDLSGLTLRSGLSDVSAAGTLLLPRGEEGEVDGIDFHLKANPLAFRDLSGFVRTLDPGVSALADFRLQGRSSRLEVSGQASLSDGGTMDLDGNFTPSATGAVEYRFRGTASDLGLESFLGRGAVGGRIDGQVAVDLEGRDRAHLTGDLSARVDGLLLDDRETHTLVVSGTLLEGEAEVEVAGGADRWGEVRLSGSGRPLDPDPTLRVEGTFLQAGSAAGPTGNLLEQNGIQELEAYLSLRTEGVSVDSAVAELKVETRRGSYRGLSLDGGELTASWRAGEGAFALRQPMGDGQVAARGEIGWRNDPKARGEPLRLLTYSLSDLEIQDLDLSRLLGDTLPSRVNARASLAGAGTDPRTLRATAEVHLGASEFRGVVVDSALARPGLEDGNLSASLEGWLGVPGVEGSVPEDGTPLSREGEGDRSGRSTREPGRGGTILGVLRGRPFDTEPSFTLDSLAFSGLDLAIVGGFPTSLHGVIRARMEGSNLRTGRTSGEITLAPSGIRDTSVEAGEGTFSLSDGELQISGQFHSPDGGLRFRGGAHPFAEPGEFRLDAVEARELNLGPFLGTETVRSNLNFDLNASGSGSLPRTLEGSGRVAVLPSTLNQGTIQGGSLALDATGGSGTAQGEIRTGEGEITLQVVASLSEGLQDLRAETQLDVPDLAGFLGREDSEVEAHGEITVTRATNGNLEFGSRLHGRIDAATIDTLTFQGSLEDAALRVDTVLVRSEILEADGGGRFALKEDGGAGESNLRMTAHVLDLSPLGTLLGLEDVEAGPGRGDIHVTGPAGAPVVAASLDLGRWRVKRISGDSARVTADYGPDDLTLTAWIQEPGEGGSIDLAVRADPREEERRGTLESLEVITPTTQWTLDTPVPFSWKDGSRIEGFVLSSSEGRISVDGTIDPRGSQDLTLRLEEASLSGVARPLGLEDLTLLADGELVLTGPAASPVAEGDLRMMVAVREQPSTSVDAHFSLAEGALTLGAQATDPGGGTLTLDGSLPLAFSLAPGAEPPTTEASPSAGARSERGSVDLTLRSDSFEISWVRSLIPSGRVTALEGILSADLQASGSFDSPTLQGRIGLADGVLRLSPSGARYQEINVAAEGGNEEIRITRASARSGSGTATIQGLITVHDLKPEDLDLTARFDRFLAWRSPTVNAELTGDLALSGSALSGSVQEPRLAGNLGLEGSKIELDDVSAGNELAAVELTEEDYRMLEDYFGIRPDRAEESPTQLMDRFGLDLGLHFDRDVWVNRSRQPRVSLEIRGELDLEKEPGGELRAVGTVETLPGRSYFRQFGRRFAVQEGELYLTGPLSEFSFTMDAVWEVPSHTNPDEAEVTVNLEVVGNAESLRLTLSSDPDMDEADIVSYLATGKSQSALVASDAEASSLGTSMAMGAMAGVLEGLAGDAVELDVVEIKVDPVRGNTLIAGRYVSPDLYLGFRQPVTFSESTKRARSENQYSEVELEYRWVRWLNMNIQGGASEIRFFLKARYAY